MANLTKAEREALALSLGLPKNATPKEIKKAKEDQDASKIPGATSEVPELKVPAKEKLPEGSELLETIKKLAERVERAENRADRAEAATQALAVANAKKAGAYIKKPAKLPLGCKWINVTLEELKQYQLDSRVYGLKVEKTPVRGKVVLSYTAAILPELKPVEE